MIAALFSIPHYLNVGNVGYKNVNENVNLEDVTSASFWSVRMNLHVQLVAGRTCKVRDKLCCTSCNVIYLINCKLCKEQYEDFAFKGKFKPRFRVHKRDVKLVKIDVVWCSLLSFAKVLILIRYS